MSQHPKPATYYYTLIQNACFILHRTTCLYSEAAIWVGGWFLGYGALPARLVVGALRFTRLGVWDFVHLLSGGLQALMCRF